jgi:hypothetical protein
MRGTSYLTRRHEQPFLSLLIFLLFLEVKSVAMEHKEGAISTIGQGEVALGTQKGMAETGVSLEYFDRYERSRGYESMGASNVDYWLSEDEEEDSQQLKRQTRKSRNKREPYVVQEAKAPKLRPAEGILPTV